jgi:hypothetical protein
MYYAPSSRTPERTIGRSKPRFVERCVGDLGKRSARFRARRPYAASLSDKPRKDAYWKQSPGDCWPEWRGLRHSRADSGLRTTTRLWNQCRGLIPECPLLQDHPAVPWLLLGRGYRTLPRTGRRLEREDCALRDVGSDRARSGQEPLPREV